MRSPILKKFWAEGLKKLTFRLIPLRLVLVIPFVLQVSIAVGLTGYLSLQNGQKAVHDLAAQLQIEVSHRIDQHLDSYLTLPHQILTIDTQLIEDRQIDPHNFAKISDHFWQEVRSFDVSYINYGLATGEFAGAGYLTDDPANSTPTMSETSAFTHEINVNYFTNVQGRRIKTEPDPTYDHRTEAWYLDAIKAGKPIWSDIYTWDGQAPILSIAASCPIHDDQGQVVGAIGVDLLLSQISNFLRQLHASPSSRTFIIERSGLIVASSGTEQPFKIVKGERQRIAAIDSPDPAIRATAQFLSRSFQQINQPQQLEFWRQGQRQFVQVMPWQDAYGLDWLAIVTVPESDFMAQINANTRTTILLCLGALGLTTLLGIVTSKWMAQPILHLSRASIAIAAGKFEAGKFDQRVTESRVKEIGVLERSFNHMAHQLQESFVALETTNQQLEQANQALEKSNESLEERVAQRTLELSETLQHLQYTQAQLIQTEKMSSLGQMVAGIAHEINNPVNFIHGNLTYTADQLKVLLELLDLYRTHCPQPIAEIQTLLETSDINFLMEDLPKVLSSMQVGAWRIYEIILSLRNFVRLDETGMKSVDIHEGLDSALLLLQHRLKGDEQQRKFQIRKSYHNLPLIKCYPGQLNQVFINLLSNAIDAIEEACACSQTCAQKERVRCGILSIATSKLDSNTIAIQISDNGIGIQTEIQSKIFDHFFTTKVVGKGTGLGLSVSYQIIVEQHKGQLSCVSTVGKGTEFTIILPIEQF
jgi:signal transduction histidine kinase